MTEAKEQYETIQLGSFNKAAGVLTISADFLNTLFITDHESKLEVVCRNRNSLPWL